MADCECQKRCSPWCSVGGPGALYGVLKLAGICDDRAQFAARSVGMSQASVGLQSRRLSRLGRELRRQRGAPQGVSADRATSYAVD